MRNSEHNNEIVVGLDIGTTKICVIVGRNDEFGKLEILGVGKAVSDGVMRGMVTNIDKTVNAINKALKDAEDQSGIDIGVVNVGIAGQHIRSARHNGHIMKGERDGEITVKDVEHLKDNMYRLAMPPGNEIIHAMPQDYTVDFEPGVKDPVGMSGTRLEADFHIITAQTTAISNIAKCIKRSGIKEPLRIDNLILEPIASSLSVLSKEDKEAGVVLVDIGGGTTDVAIFYDDIIRHTAVIPFGGNIITSDIKDGCGVMMAQAEELKLKFGKALASEAKENEIISIPGLRGRAPKEISVKNLAHIIEARMQDIIELVNKEIYSSGFADKLAAGMVITGGGSQLQYVQHLFEFMTGIPTQVGLPNEHLGSKGEFKNVLKSPLYATSVGLVLTGFKALDDRENRYAEFATPQAANKVLQKNKSGDFIANIIGRTKRFLLDDDGYDKSGY